MDYQSFVGKEVKIACSPGCEADQVISSIVYGLHNKVMRNLNASQDLTSDWMLKKFQNWDKSPLALKDHYDEIVVGTTDSDIYQLLKFPKVHMSTRTNGSDYHDRTTPTAVKFCTPEQIPVYKALVGDISDNIPNVLQNKSKKTIDLVLEVLNSLDDLNKFITFLETGTGKETWVSGN